MLTRPAYSGAGGEAGVAFHRGVLRGLEESGIDPREAEIVVGTSAGALVFCDTTVRGGSAAYLPFFFAAGFAPDFVVFFETGFLAAAIWGPPLVGLRV